MAGPPVRGAFGIRSGGYAWFLGIVLVSLKAP